MQIDACFGESHNDDGEAKFSHELLGVSVGMFRESSINNTLIVYEIGKHHTSDHLLKAYEAIYFLGIHKTGKISKTMHL